MSKPRVENIENLWRNIEGPPPSIPFKLEESLNVADFDETDEIYVENPFEGTTYRPPGTEPYDDPFESNEDYGDYDAEVEIINLNKRVSREFSLSHYDVNIHEFGRLRAKYANNIDGDDVHESEDLQSRELIQNGEYHSGELSDSNSAVREINHVQHGSHDYEGSNDGTGSGHLICDCEDCINQTEVVECQCENCVQSGEVIHHSPPAGEATCDCDNCLNNSAESYSCECENCRTGEKVLNNNKPNETCKCENCVDPEDVGDYSGENVGDYSGENVGNYSGEVCLCEKCCSEDELTNHVHINGADNGGPERFRGLRGSPLGSSQQFDLPRIEEVDQLEEEEHSYVNDFSHEYANHIDNEHADEFDNEYADHESNEYANRNIETEKFANELFTKLEKVKHNGSEKQNNTEVLNRNSSKLIHKQKFKHEPVLSKHKDRNVFNKESKEKQHNLSDSEIQSSNPSLESDSTVTQDGFTHHRAFRGQSDCEFRDCSGPERGHNQGFRPPRGHNHVIQPLAVNISGLLEDQLQKAEKDLKKRETDYTNEIHELQKENDKQQKIIAKSLSLTTEAKIEATMQHEITRLTAENLDLREIIDKKDSEIKKLKKMIKHYAKRLKDGEAAEIQAELEKEEAKSVENVATIKHRERNYMGMLEYKKENENQLIKTIITDLRPKVAAGLLPGLPAYILFMCVRHTDYVNDDEKVRSLLTSTINGVKKAVKKHHDDLDRVTLWLANTCRFLHTLKQYSGEKAFSQENTPRQNEHCLRNFDLAEYRQVFSDLAVWIYQTLIKLMEATIQPSIVAAVLEHEAIAGLSGSKPSGMRGRSSSRAEDTPEYSLDSLMKSLNQFVRTLSQHAVDPELVKQIFRQLYYFIGASALNNLLLRKDMCNWSKGMQIRYNLSHLEQWLRDSKLQESGAGTALEPIVQASQLLQARKTEADVESVCDMCSKLTIPQIVKILNLYTPVDEFEERVPISFIRKLQQHLKNRPNQESHLLMDLKFSFSVTFPFNPSNISLESVEIPDSLHLTGVTKL